MAQLGGSDNLQPSGFFVLRTPLLPFDELREWSDGVQAPRALGDRDQLESALSIDRALLTERLRGAWRTPAVREAVFLASPELHTALERSEPESVTDARAKAVRSLVAYYARMTGRCTPFGLFAGCGVGPLDRRTRLELPARPAYKRHTRLDMDFLSALVNALEADAVVRQTLRYQPNSSLYRAAGRLHYAESRVDKSGRSHHLVAVEETQELRETLERASSGACLNDLAAALVGDQVGADDAREFIDELVASQLLVSDLGPDVTGDEAVHGLIRRLGTCPETRAVATTLEHVRDGLASVDQTSVGGTAPERYAELRASLEPLPVKAEPARLFQVDMIKPADGLSLGTAVVDELLRGLTIVHQVARVEDRRDPLRTFRERFTARYEEAEVALVEVLDEEIGIGFAASTEPGGEPLLQRLDPVPPTPDPEPWQARDRFLLRRLAEALRRGEQQITLQPADIEELASPEPRPPLPDALQVHARLAAASAQAIDRGDFRVWFQGASGPSGARLLGRFCQADQALHRHVEEHLRAEEAHRPDAVFAEIVHLPEGRLGNILSRPVLRDYEITFLGQSGAACDRQISVTDLRVSVRGGRVILRSARLNREVIPRLTTAHNFTRRSLGVYRFLCALQHQGVTAGLGWSWGPLERAPFLPRVASGRLVLARACWNLDAAELKPVVQARGAAQFAAAQELRQARGLPRYVALAEADHELLIDFDNVLSVEAFLHLVKDRNEVRLVELFPPPDELCVVGPEGRFLNELVVPFVKAPAPSTPRALTGVPTSVRRRFPPGSEWLYLKLYCGPAIADRVLVEAVRPAVDAALGGGTADGWFFIRYADPDHHLRVRFHGDPRRLAAELIPDLFARFGPLVEDSRISRWQLDTYIREVERYGGDDGIRLAERFFCLDSECVLAILESTSGDEGLSWRWKLAVCGVDQLLDQLGFGLEDKCNWARRQRDAFAREFRINSRLRQQLGDKYRTERQGLDDLLALARSADGAQYPALRALQRRGKGLAAIGAELDVLRRAGRLEVTMPDLAASYAHMHLNRLLRSAWRFQELAIYELLDRTYRSQLTRAGGG